MYQVNKNSHTLSSSEGRSGSIATNPLFQTYILILKTIFSAHTWVYFK